VRPELHSQSIPIDGGECSNVHFPGDGRAQRLSRFSKDIGGEFYNDLRLTLAFIPYRGSRFRCPPRRRRQIARYCILGVLKFPRDLISHLRRRTTHEYVTVHKIEQCCNLPCCNLPYGCLLAISDHLSARSCEALNLAITVLASVKRSS
jgi:hypothetical protein